VTLLRPGLDLLRSLTGRPVLGVLPFAHGLGIDEEDGLRARESKAAAPPLGEDVLRVAVAAVPLMSNFTDVDALAAEPGVVVRFVDRPEEIADADLVVLPGTRGTVRALEWLRARGLAAAVRRRAAEGRPVLGVCGGFQMLGTWIEDDVESRAGTVEGLGLLPVRFRFAAEKTLARPEGRALGQPATRSTTGWPNSSAATRSSSTAAGRARCGAHTGTARWRATASAGSSCGWWPGWPAGASSPRRTRRSPRCARSNWTASPT
jgi:adenosylcobyric acid synthase